MSLYIRIKDGQPFEHPITEDNMRMAFPDIDLNNLPSNFAKFERVLQPNAAKTFEVEEGSYGFIDGIYKDVWTVRPMTDRERQAKELEIETSFNNFVINQKEFAQNQINNVTDPEEKTAWEFYLNNLNQLVLTNYENIIYPVPPFRDSEGRLISVNKPGTKPNVIE